MLTFKKVFQNCIWSTNNISCNCWCFENSQIKKSRIHSNFQPLKYIFQLLTLSSFATLLGADKQHNVDIFCAYCLFFKSLIREEKKRNYVIPPQVV